MKPVFDAGRFSTLVAERALSLGRSVSVRAVTESTNDDALRAAREGAPAGSLFVADEQRRGRGRRGSTWHSDPKTSVTFSVLLRPAFPAERASALSLVAGLAVREVVATLLAESGRSAKASVKWPNDVLIDRRKVAGILVESHVQGGRLAAAVVGIGLNTGRVNLPEDVAKRATSLEEQGAKDTTREELVVNILGELELRLTGLDHESDREMLPDSLLSELRKNDALLGLRVSVGEIVGLASGIDAEGYLLVRDERGKIATMTAGHVEILGG